MKKSFFIFIILIGIVLNSCSLLNSSNKRVYKISVIDLETNLPIDGAKIDLVAMVDARDVYKQMNFTNRKGVFKFKTNYPDRSQITVKATKKGYHQYWVNNTDGKNLGYYYLENKNDKNVTLYLTKKAIDEIFKKPDYHVDLIAKQLVANKYCSPCSLPELEWEDIPKLLEIANNTNIINKYPTHPLSSMSSVDCYGGIVALWFVEYIRVSEQDKNVRAISKFPYQLPQLIYLGQSNSASNTKEQMLIAYTHYMEWWENSKDTLSQNASMVNPLSNSNIRWSISLNLPK